MKAKNQAKKTVRRSTTRTAATRTATPAPKAPKTTPSVRSPEPMLASLPTTNDVQGMIADAAYYRAEKRGFIPGHELEDWLLAERSVNDQIGI